MGRFMRPLDLWIKWPLLSNMVTLPLRDTKFRFGDMICYLIILIWFATALGTGFYLAGFLVVNYPMFPWVECFLRVAVAR